MKSSHRTMWQFAAGDSNRSYQDVCLRWDAIIFGPGYAGPWPECEARLLADGRTPKKMEIVRKFAEDTSEGDLVFLRLGTSEIYGVGEVVGDYAWFDDFGDIDGWHLGHVRRVRWLWRYDGSPQRFETYTLKLGDTLQPMTSEVVSEWFDGLTIPEEMRSRSLQKLPATCVPSADTKLDISMDTIANSLFDEGVAAGSIDALVSGMDELKRIASWYDRSDTSPSESETIAYLVVPLLRALGWTPQRMAVEWNHVDLALFSQMPRQDDNLAVAVEVKKRGLSCLNAKSQAERYAEEPGREGCLRLIVTDGIRYGVYVRRSGEAFLDGPTAYLNLNRMMSAYSILECDGAAEALRLMAPDWSEP